MSEADIGEIQAMFACGPQCPHCKAIVTPAEVMDEHVLMCAEIAALKKLSNDDATV